MLRRAQAEPRAKLGVDDRDRLGNGVFGDRRRHVGKPQVRRHQRDAKAAADEHHHDARRAGALREEFGVAHEREAGVGERALLHGRGHQRLEIAAGARVARAREHLIHRVRVGRVGMTGPHRRGERLVPHFDDTAGRRERQRIEVRIHRRKTDARRARGEQVAIAERDEARRQRTLALAHREHRDDLRADACGLARGDRDRRPDFH